MKIMKLIRISVITVAVSLFALGVLPSGTYAGRGNYNNFSVHEYALTADPGEDPHIHVDPVPRIVTPGMIEGEESNQGGGSANILYREEGDSNSCNKDANLPMRWEWQLNLKIILMILL